MVFGSDYANVYDLIYADKDYSLECDLIEDLFSRFGRQEVRSVLDLGCGTGRHSLELARRGYDVCGVDLSSDMLQIARASATASPSLRFHQGDIRTVDLEEEFDAVLVMFAVLGYQLTNIDLEASLSTCRRHLPTGGILLFDVWWGPAVTKIGPSVRERTISLEDGELKREATGRLDGSGRVCTVDYKLTSSIRGGTDRVFTESHKVRVFFDYEIEDLLKASGFRLHRIGAFPEFGQEPDAQTWNVLVAATAI